MAVFPLDPPTMEGAASKLSGVSFMSTLIPLLRVSPSRLITPKDTPPNVITLGFRFQHRSSVVRGAQTLSPWLLLPHTTTAVLITSYNKPLIRSIQELPSNGRILQVQVFLHLTSNS